MKRSKNIATITDIDARVKKLTQTTQREVAPFRQGKATKSDIRDILLAIQSIHLHISALERKIRAS